MIYRLISNYQNFRYLNNLKMIAQKKESVSFLRINSFKLKILNINIIYYYYIREHDLKKYILQIFKTVKKKLKKFFL